MSANVKMVGPAEFCKQTGFAKQTFYNCLEKMKAVGIAAKTQKKIDLNSQWMQDYIERERGLSSSKSYTCEEPTDDEIAESVDVYNPGSAPIDMSKVEQMIRVETLNKLMIDNAIKAKRVISRSIVSALIEKIDDAWSKIIMDGEASFVPQLMQKIKAGCSEEEAKKFWRKEISKILAPVKPFMKRTVEHHTSDKK